MRSSADAVSEEQCVGAAWNSGDALTKWTKCLTDLQSDKSPIRGRSPLLAFTRDSKLVRSNNLGARICFFDVPPLSSSGYSSCYGMTPKEKIENRSPSLSRRGQGVRQEAGQA